MSYFDFSVNKTLEYEGGYTWDPADSGGETNFGISKRQYPSLNIMKLTKEEAIALYKRDYWDANKLDEIKDQMVAAQMFDILVNGGPKVIQQAVNKLKPNTLKEDGSIGPATRAAVNSCDARTLCNQMCRKRSFRFVELVKANPTQIKFMTSWLDRTFGYIYI